MEVMRACGNCRFFQPGGDYKDGECRHSPPDVYYYPDWQYENTIEICDDEDDEVMVEVQEYSDSTYVGWPIVHSHDWCGAYQPQNNEQLG